MLYQRRNMPRSLGRLQRGIIDGGLLGLALISRRRGGGASMLLGGNLGQSTTYSNVFPYVNLMYASGSWERNAGGGSGAFSQFCGELVASVSTDEFACYITTDGLGLPSGTYRILNPTGAEIRLTDFVTSPAYTTSTDFTFNYTTGHPLILILRGSLLRHASQKFAILKPGTYTQWQAGNIWDADFLAFLQGLHLTNLRFMDWGATNTNLEVDWADTTPANAISFSNRFSQAIRPPIEVMCDLANRLSVNPWLNVPTRASAAYATAMATAIQANLNSGLPPYIEYGNEIWNYVPPFSDNTRWVEFKDHTRRTATCVGGGSNNYTLTAHGIANGSLVRPFRTKENAAAGISVDGDAQNGSTVYLEVVDANTFRLHSGGSVAGPVVPVVTGQVNIVFIVENEAGKVAGMDTHYGEAALAHFNTIDAVLGSTGYRHVLGAAAVSPTMVSARLAVPGFSAKVDDVAIAPYFYAAWFHAAIDRASGTLTPKVWGSGNLTVYCGQYAAGSTPTNTEVIAGTGTGYIAKQTIAVAAGSSVYTAGSAFAGTNGTNYEIFMVVDDGTYQWRLASTISPNAVASTTYVPDSDANQGRRDRLAHVVSKDRVAAVTAVVGSKRMIAYEGGSHFDAAAPAAAYAWLATHLASPEYAAALGYYLRTMAAAGMSLFDYFVTDAMSGFSSWKIADSYTGTSDNRYLAVAGLNGRVAKTTQLAIADTTGTDFLVAPGAFPQTIKAFADPSLTYTILAGNDAGNYDISGGALRLIAANGINWGAPATPAVLLAATNGVTETTFTVRFNTGNAWYESDALFALDMTTQSDPSVLTVGKGTNLARSGSGGTFTGGLLSVGAGDSYAATLALTGTPSWTGTLLVAMVLKKNGSYNTFGQTVQIGNVSFIALAGAPNYPYWRFYRGPDTGFSNGYQAAWNANSTAFVQWLLLDYANAKAYYGRDQSEFSAVGGEVLDTTNPGAAFARLISLTSDASEYKGSLQIVNRSGLTLAQAKAIVAKMQTLHSIP
jgi:hypothetical protein